MLFATFSYLFPSLSFVWVWGLTLNWTSSIGLIAVVADTFAPTTCSIIVHVFLVMSHLQEQLAIAAIVVAASISEVAHPIVVEVIEVWLLLLLLLLVSGVVVEAHGIEREARIEILSIG